MAMKVEILVEGGKATPAPPLGPKLGELKMNVGEVISEINNKTAEFKGMKVPVILDINDDKTYQVSVGTPPVSQLIKKETGIAKGSGEPNINKVANLAIEQVIKIAKMKESSMFSKNLKSVVKSIVGSCNSAGILVEGKSANDINSEIDNGVYDKEINEVKTEVSAEKKSKLGKALTEVQKEFKKEQERLAAEKEAEEEKKKEAEEVTEEKPEEKEEEKKEEEKEKPIEEEKKE